MAEGFAKKYWGQEFTIFSAGTKKYGMNARAVRVMAEAGVNLSTHFSKTVGELPAVSFDYVVTVCDHAHENCPIFTGGKIIHVGFEDPPALTKGFTNEEEILKVYRRVRDEIEAFIKDLKKYLS